MNRTIWIGIVVIILAAGGWWYISQSNAMSQPTPQPAAQSVAQPTTRSQLAIDLSSVTPKFVEYKEDPTTGEQVLSPDLEKIKNDAAAILIGPGPYDPSAGPDILLNAVGTRYVEVTITHPTDAGSSPQILDSVTLRSVPISGLFQFTIGATAVYVSATDICTYTLNTPSCVPVPGAKLSGITTTGGEVYGDDETQGGYFVAQDLSHTNTSMTIAVLALVNPGTDQVKLQKARDVTLPLP
jgi:hypothetical protein